MAQIAVLGAGMMGTALCFPLADAGHRVHLVGTPLDETRLDALLSSRPHPGLGVRLPEGVRCFRAPELLAAAEPVEALVLGVSSAGIEWAVHALEPLLRRRSRPLAMITKGLELAAEGPRILPDALAARLSAAGIACAPIAICGPCIAGELARRVPTLAVLAGRDGAALASFAGWLAGSYYQPRQVSDLIGAQLCAALKNAYALGVAFAAGLHERAGGERGSVALHNYEAAVFAQASVEMTALVTSLGGSAATVAGLAGVGDLLVTCNGGRTGRLGALLGRGIPLGDAVESMAGATLECLEMLEVCERWFTRDAAGQRAHEQCPLLSHLIDVGLRGAPVAMPFDAFFGGA